MRSLPSLHQTNIWVWFYRQPKFSLSFNSNNIKSFKTCQFFHQVRLLSYLQTQFVYQMNMDDGFKKLIKNPAMKMATSSKKPLYEIPTFSQKFVANCPISFQPYLKLMRVDSPTGGWLLLWPGYLGIALSTAPCQVPHPYYLFIFALGTILMRGVGCTVNDIFDKKIDSKIERTKLRPLASNQLSTTNSVVFLLIQSSLALSLLLKFDYNSILLGLSSVGLVLFYPLAKRYTYWPQLVLGLTFNWGALLGCSVVTNGNMYLPAAIPLYLSCISWTLIYDTIYAHQDKNEDLKIGVKSTALLFDNDTKYWLTCFSLSMLSFLAMSGYTTDQTWPFYFSLGAAGAKLYSIISTLDVNDSYNCFKKFKDNVNIGIILFIGIVIGNLFKKKKEKNFKESEA